MLIIYLKALCFCAADDRWSKQTDTSTYFHAKMSTKVAVCHLICINTISITALHSPKQVCLEPGNYQLSILCYSWQYTGIKTVAKRFPSYLHLSICFSSVRNIQNTALFVWKRRLCQLFTDFCHTAWGGNTFLDYSQDCRDLTIETSFTTSINISNTTF